MMPEPSVSPAEPTLQTKARGTHRQRTVLLSLCYFLALAALLWPALYNRQPLFFPDTIAYFDRPLRAIKDAAEYGLSIWHGVEADLPGSEPAVDENSILSPREPQDFIIGGRSPYYGLLVTAGYLLGGFWASIILQGIIILGAFSLLYRMFLVGNPFLAPCSVIILAAISPLSFFSSYLMPDFLTGIAILASAALLAGEERMERHMRWFWFLLLVYAICTHSSHLGIAVLLLLTAPILALIRSRPIPLRGMGLVLSAVLVGIGAQVLVNHAIKSAYGVAPTSPPFLSARLAQDEPGVSYLKETCPQNGFEICRFVDRFPLNSDDFLWSKDPEASVFAGADPDLKAALSKEQFSLALAVIRHDAPAQLKSSLVNFSRQLLRFRINEFQLEKGHIDYIEHSLAKAGVSQDVHNIDQAVLHMNYPIYFSLLASTIGMFFLLGGGRRFVSEPFPIFALIVIAGVFANAAITGVFSTVHDRYQARVVWLLPALGLLALILIFQYHGSKANDVVERDG